MTVPEKKEVVIMKNFDFGCFFKFLFSAICFDIFREIILDLL